MKSNRFWMSLTVVSIFVFFFLNLFIGSIHIPMHSIWNIVFGIGNEDPVMANIIWKTRIPQTLVALFAGAGLSIAGLLMQTVFNNPLAGPSVLGISSGSSLGVAFVVLLSGNVVGVALSKAGFAGEMAITVAAIVGAMSVMALIVYVAKRVKGNVTLLIIGVMIGYVATAIIGVLKFFSVEEDVKAYVIWGLGSYSRISGDQVIVFSVLMIALIPLSFLLVKSLNLMLLGEGYAKNLGLDVRKARIQIILVASVLIAVVTAYCGPIAFLGLAVPHLCRALFRTAEHKTLMFAVTFVGASLSLLCNFIAKAPGFEGALPINSVTALIGAPIVASVIFKKRRVEAAE